MPQEAIGQMSEETINRAKEEFQSHSPSQVMYQLGFDINQGLANGINENSFSPLGAVQSLGQLLLSGFSGLASGGYTAGFNLVNSFTSSIGLNSPLATSAAGSLAFGAAGAALANSTLRSWAESFVNYVERYQYACRHGERNCSQHGIGWR